MENWRKAKPRNCLFAGTMTSHSSLQKKLTQLGARCIRDQCPEPRRGQIGNTSLDPHCGVQQQLPRRPPLGNRRGGRERGRGSLIGDHQPSPTQNERPNKREKLAMLPSHFLVSLPPFRLAGRSPVSLPFTTSLFGLLADPFGSIPPPQSKEERKEESRTERSNQYQRKRKEEVGG